MRIGARTVPVKDRYRDKGREKDMNSRRGETKKNAANKGALRRVEQKTGKTENRRLTANNQNLGGFSDGVYGTLPSP